MASRSIKVGYLVGYNSLLALGWAYIARKLLLSYFIGQSRASFFDESFPILLFVQSLAILEILHSAIGIVKSPIMTSLMQVISRLFIVWIVLYTYQAQLKSSIFYQTLLFAWSMAEIVRYNAFLVLYPIGVFSEVSLTFIMTQYISHKPLLRSILRFVVIPIYIPGLYVLYSHMLKQRRKFLYASDRQKT